VKVLYTAFHLCSFYYSTRSSFGVTFENPKIARNY